MKDAPAGFEIVQTRCGASSKEMELSIKTVGECSSISGVPFAVGDEVWSYLYRGGEGQIERADVLAQERGDLQLEGGFLCRWCHRIRERGATEAELRREALQNSEAVFLSLYEEGGEEAAAPESGLTRAQLKFFLAVQLERKRVLRHLGPGRYRHVALKRVFEVEEFPFTPELVSALLSADAVSTDSPAP